MVHMSVVVEVKDARSCGPAAEEGLVVVTSSWIVEVFCRSPKLTGKQLKAIDARAHSRSFDAVTGRLIVGLEVKASTMRAAALEAFEAAQALPVEPIGLLRLLPVDEYLREVQTSALLDLCGASEAAQILGVSPQRVIQLAEEHPEFPRAAAVLKRGQVWMTEDIKRFQEQRQAPSRRSTREPATKESGRS